MVKEWGCGPKRGNEWEVLSGKKGGGGGGAERGFMRGFWGGRKENLGVRGGVWGWRMGIWGSYEDFGGGNENLKAYRGDFGVHGVG